MYFHKIELLQGLKVQYDAIMQEQRCFSFSVKKEKELLIKKHRTTRGISKISQHLLFFNPKILQQSLMNQQSCPVSVTMVTSASAPDKRTES